MTVRRREPAKRPGRESRDSEDTALRSLSAEDRSKLSMDAWEPSLLRKLLKAQNRLRSRGKR